MSHHHRITGLIAALGLALAGSALAHPQGGAGRMDGMDGMGGHGGMAGHQGMHGAMQGDLHGDGAAGQLMTPQEREAQREKMRSARSPQERQALAAANRAELEKRAKEKGITLPEQHGAHRGGQGHQH